MFRRRPGGRAAVRALGALAAAALGCSRDSCSSNTASPAPGRQPAPSPRWSDGACLPRGGSAALVHAGAGAALEPLRIAAAASALVALAGAYAVILPGITSLLVALPM